MEKGEMLMNNYGRKMDKAGCKRERGIQADAEAT